MNSGHREAESVSKTKKLMNTYLSDKVKDRRTSPRDLVNILNGITPMIAFRMGSQGCVKV